MERKLGEGVMLEDYKGLAKEYPWIALAMTVFMLSLAGVPPTAGFAAKFYVFRAAVEAELVWLAIIGVVTSVVSAFYYLRVVYYMFMFDGEVADHAATGADYGDGHHRRGHVPLRYPAGVGL